MNFNRRNLLKGGRRRVPSVCQRYRETLFQGHPLG